MTTDQAIKKLLEYCTSEKRGLIQNANAGAEYKIRDISGRMVDGGKVSDQIDISLLEPGCYVFSYFRKDIYVNRLFTKQ